MAGLNGDAKAMTEALALQDRVARSDFIIVKAGVQGTASPPPPKRMEMR